MKKGVVNLDYRPEKYDWLGKNEVCIASIYYLYSPGNSTLIYVKAIRTGKTITYQLSGPLVEELNIDPKTLQSTSPLSLRELVEFSKGIPTAAWYPLYNSGDDLNEILDISVVESDYYSQFSEYYKQEAKRYYQELIKQNSKSRCNQLDDSDLIETAKDWYEKGANIHSLSKILEDRGTKVLSLLKSSKIKNKTDILNTIMHLAKQPFKDLPGSMWGNIAVKSFNHDLQIIKNETRA